MNSRKVSIIIVLLLGLALCSPVNAGHLASTGFDFRNHFSANGVLIYDDIGSSGTSHSGSFATPNGVTFLYEANSGSAVDTPSEVGTTGTSLHVAASGINTGQGSVTGGGIVTASYACVYGYDIGQSDPDILKQFAEVGVSGYAAAGDTVNVQLQAKGNILIGGGQTLSTNFTGPGGFFFSLGPLLVFQEGQPSPMQYKGDLYISVSITRAPGGGPAVPSYSPSYSYDSDPTETYVDITLGSVGSGVVPEPSSLLLCLAGIFASQLRRQRAARQSLSDTLLF